MKKRALIEAVENRMLLSANVTLNFTGTSEPVMLWKSGSTVRFGRWSGDTYYFDSNNSNPNTSSGPNSSWSWASNDPRTFIIKLGGGADTFTIDPSFVTAGIGLLTFNIDGENGWDTITGGANNDTITGGADTGRDQLSGSGGNDSLTGGDGDDILSGDTGNDTIEAGLGADSAVGGSGNDYIVGSIGQDTIQGGADGDVVIGGDGNDCIQGNSGDDRLFGELGVDSLDGGDGTNVMFGGLGVLPIVSGVQTRDLLVDGGSTSTSIALIHAQSTAPLVSSNFTEDVANDAAIDLSDSTGTNSSTWAENAVSSITSAFLKLRIRTGDNKLLYTFDSQRVVIFRVDIDPARPTALAVNYGGGEIALFTEAYDQANQVVDPVWSTLIHEFGHNWDASAENSQSDTFANLSGWINNPTPAQQVGRTRKNSAITWWYNTGSNFVSDYARDSRFEDFAETFAATFNSSSPRYNGSQNASYSATLASSKMTNMTNWLDSL